MAHNYQKDTMTKNDNVIDNVLAIKKNIISIEKISETGRCNIINEINHFLEDPRKNMESVTTKENNTNYDDNLSDEEMYWDNNILDILQVECNEDSNSLELLDDTSISIKKKIYPIENYCAVCNKRFSCQKNFSQHAQQAHPGEKTFKCLHCPTLFSKLKSISAHLKRSHTELKCQKHVNSMLNNELQTCQLGNNTHIENNDLTDDTFLNRKGKIYPIHNQCAICIRKFSFQRDLVKHTQEEHPNAKVFKCLYCPTLFSKLKSVTSHYKRSHSKFKKTIICDYCNMKFFTQFLLERHRRSHTEQRPFACSQCDKTYKYKRNLLVHMKTHSKDAKSVNIKIGNNKKDDYIKNKEQRLFSRDTEQNAALLDERCGTHDQTCLKDTEGDGINISALATGEKCNLITQYPFKCNECDRVYKYKKNLKSHEKCHRQTNEVTERMNLDHTSENIQDTINFYNSTYFIIDELNTESENVEDLGEEQCAAAHYSDEYDHEDCSSVSLENSADDKQNECGICRKPFKCQQSVAKHLQRCHAEIEFFKCPYCDDNFYSLEGLSLHITTKKHAQKRNVCEMCLKSFDRKSDLKRHIRTHTDERPYACNICHKHFKQTNHLKRHKELNHDNANKPLKFSCDLCVKSFLLEETLQRHMIMHEKETQFPCKM